jgi:hypothetical protein
MINEINIKCRLLAALKDLDDAGPHDLKSGICSNLVQHYFQNSTKQEQQEVLRIIEELSAKWPLSSENLNYPVEGDPDTYHNPYTLKWGQSFYGGLRRSLLNYCISELELELDAALGLGLGLQ